MSTLAHLAKHGVAASWEPMTDSLITRIRNFYVARFMVTDFTHLMFIDSDLAWNPDALLGLIQADKPVVCGSYPKKQTNLEFVFNVADPDAVNVQDGLIEAKDGPTGFMLVKRGVFERMFVEYPERRCHLHQELTSEELQYSYALFDTMIDPDSIHPDSGLPMYLSEDYTFCRLWERIGGKVWIDPTVDMTHFGAAAHRGRLADYLHA